MLLLLLFLLLFMKKDVLRLVTTSKFPILKMIKHTFTRTCVQSEASSYTERS